MTIDLVDIWKDIGYGKEYMERMREGKKGTWRREAKIKEFKEKFKEIFEQSYRTHIA